MHERRNSFAAEIEKMMIFTQSFLAQFTITLHTASSKTEFKTINKTNNRAKNIKLSISIHSDEKTSQCPELLKKSAQTRIFDVCLQ